MTDVNAVRRVPTPSSVSEQAKRFLETSLPANDYPASNDTEAWLRHIETSDSFILTYFAKIDLPIASEERSIGGVRTYILRAHDVPDTDATPIYLDIHGGALISGGGEACRQMTAAAAMATGMIHWAPDYRMPPLHPYPSPLDDCLAVYRNLLEIRSTEDIVVGGASAGGNLAAALLLRARDEGLPLPGALVLMTPEVDLTESGDSFQTNLGVDSVLRGSLMAANVLYANGHDLADPYLSPLFGDVTGFPPTFLQTGTRDLFLSNTVRMHRKLRAAGVEAQLHVGEAMPHGGFGGAPEDIEMMLERRRFLDAHRRHR